MFFRFVSWKGIIAFILGMSIMAYLILSDNMLMKFIVDYIEELHRKKALRETKLEERVCDKKY